MKKIYVVGFGLDYMSWINNAIHVENMEEADIVLFTGGEDVSPSLYGEENVLSFSNPDRDMYEKTMFEEACKNNKNIIGICRGSQLLTALNGGKLIQDVTNHALASGHNIRILNKDLIMRATSTHHQMMYPFNLPKEDYKLIGVSEKRRSTHYLTANGRIISDLDEFIPYEPEIVYYYKTRSLAIQPHPELMEKDSDLVVFLNDLIEHIVAKKVNICDKHL